MSPLNVSTKNPTAEKLFDTSHINAEEVIKSIGEDIEHKFSHMIFSGFSRSLKIEITKDQSNSEYHCVLRYDIHGNDKKREEFTRQDITSIIDRINHFVIDWYEPELTTEDKKNKLLLWCAKLCDEQEFNTLRDFRQMLDFEGDLNDIFFYMSNQHIRNQSADGDGFSLDLLYRSISENKHNWTDELINELYSLVTATEEL